MLRWSWTQKTAGMMDRVGRVSVSSAGWDIVAVGSDASERDERGLMRCPQCQKGMGSMAGLDGWSYAGRLEARLWDPQSLTRWSAAPHNCVPACLAKHGPLKATCSLLSRRPAGGFHASIETSASPEYVLDSV